LDVETALKRVGKAKTSGAPSELAAVIDEARLVSKERLDKAEHASLNTGLPLGYVLVSLGCISKTRLQDVLTALWLIRSGLIDRPTAISLLGRGGSFVEALRDNDIDHHFGSTVSPLERLLHASGLISDADLLMTREHHLVKGEEIVAVLGALKLADQI